MDIFHQFLSGYLNMDSFARDNISCMCNLIKIIEEGEVEMDFRNLLKKAYEMGNVYITILTEDIEIYNTHKIIGRADNYEKSIQFSFTDDTSFLIRKTQIEAVYYSPEKITIALSNGGEIIIENQ